MTTQTPYQSKKAEAWRLMTAVQRADLLNNTVASLVDLIGEGDKTDKVLTHILAQAQHIDDSAMLTGATGESNELYNQARGKTVILATKEAKKLPVAAQVVASLLTGNQTHLNAPSQEAFAFEVKTIMANVGIDDAVFNLEDASEPESFDDMFNDPRLAQVGIVGTVEETHALAAKLSQTDAMLTQIIAITDQDELSEVFSPDYLHRFCSERVRTINTTAIGGNASLLELGAG